MLEEKDWQEDDAETTETTEKTKKMRETGVKVPYHFESK